MTMKKHALITHTECFNHVGTLGYQEIPDRLNVVLAALEDIELYKYDAPYAAHEDLLRVHSQAHITNMLQKVKAGHCVELDYDTALDSFTANAALRAVGAVCFAVDGVMDGSFKTAFCAVRPPGHHAEPERAMGFCYFNNVAIGALRAQQVYRLQRVAIIDFDVHHGNGTQAALTGVRGTYFASLHQHPHYPNSGIEVETKNIHNIPMPAGTNAEDWCRAFESKVIADLHGFQPELILVSAGFDAHKDDPLGAFNLTETDYSWLAQELRKVAGTYCEGRMISVLEGGYNLDALASSVRAYIEGT